MRGSFTRQLKYLACISALFALLVIAHASAQSGVSAPVLMWQYGGCLSGPSCQTGWYAPPAVADLDGDGQPEVVWGAYDVVALNGANGSLKWRAPNSNRVWAGLAVADLNGDGTLQVIAARDGDNLTVYNRLGNTIWTRNPFGGDGELRSLAVADLEHDGRLEILAGSAGWSSLQVNAYEPDGTVRAGWPVRHAGDPGSGSGLWNQNVVVADMNGDGFKEVFTTTGSHYMTAVNRDGSQLPVNAMYAPQQFWSEVGTAVDQAAEVRGWVNCGVEHRPDFSTSAPAIADVNGDGVLEFIAIGKVYNCGTTPYTDLYHLPFIFKLDRSRWTGSGFDWTALPAPGAGSQPRSEDFNVIEDVQPNAVAADLDGDGLKEILFPSFDGKLHAYWLDRTEHGAWPYTLPASGTGGDDFRFASEPVVADLDNDGHAEVIFTSWPKKATGRVGQLHILDYLGHELYRIDLPAPANGLTWNGALGAPTIANIDADANLELVIGTVASGVVAYKLPNTAAARILWGTGRGNYARTGLAPALALDTSPPAATITAPGSGTAVSGSVAVSATASDNVGVVGVQFRLDGANLGAEDTTAPYAIAWDTTAASNASHVLTAVARDAAGNTTTSAAVTVTVANTTGTTIRVEDTTTGVSFFRVWTENYTGTPGGWSGGSVAFSVEAGARATLMFNGTGASWIGWRGPQQGIATVYLDNVAVATVDAYAPANTVQAVLYSSPPVAAGPHTLAIEVTRTKNEASSDYLVSVDAFDVTGTPPDQTPPDADISAPAGGTSANGTVTVRADAADDVAVVGVQFFLDGAPLAAEDTAVPYTVNWDTTRAPDGPHTLTARARDGAGNTAVSAAVNVTVSNATPPPTATRVEDTDLSIIYTSGTLGPGQPPDWFHGSRSRGWSNGTATFNRSAGARATFTFNGTSISWLGFRAAWAGIARVYVDGAFVTEIDLYSTTELVQTPVFTSSPLAAGTHTLTVESTGEKNPDATDYAVVVDAFDVTSGSPPRITGSRIEETSASAAFTTGWTQGDTTQAWSGGTAAVSATPATPGARATWTFTGTSVNWIGLRGPRSGIARVYLDGAFQGTIDTYAPTAYQGVVYAVTKLAQASHTLAIEVTGQKNAAAADSLVYVDAMDVQSRVEDDDRSITYSGSWVPDTAQNWSGSSLETGAGTATRAAAAGARADFAFTGTSVTWIGFRGPWIGMADVSIDGGAVTRVDLYSPAEQVQVPVFTATGLAAGSHTLRIDVVGDKNPASTSTWVFVDAFDIPPQLPAPSVRRVQETDPSVAFTSDWTPAGQASLWSGEHANQSVTAGGRATFGFTGTTVRWIGERGFDTGLANVSIDGVFIAQIDTSTSLQEGYQAVLFSATGLAPGSHTLTIDVVGRQNEPPGATVERVVIDAFDVY